MTFHSDTYMYSVFAHDKFTLFFNASLHCSSSHSSTSFSLAHSTSSSANIICQGASFLIFSVNESIMMDNRKRLKADPSVRLFLQHTSLQFHIDGTCPSLVWCTSLAPIAPIQFFPQDSVVSRIEYANLGDLVLS